MIVDCQSCGATYNISDDKVRGRRVRVRCKSCGDGIIVDGAQLAAEDATRVYSPSFEPAAYAEAEGRDESTRVMSSPVVDWREPDPTEWTVNLSETEQRTMSSDELVRGYNSGTIGDETAFVWRDGMTDWLPVKSVPELRSAIDSAEATRVVSPARGGSRPLGRGAAAAYTPPPAYAAPPAYTPPPAYAAPPTAVTYSAPAAPPRAVQWAPAAEATVEYAPPRPPPAPSAMAPARQAVAPARAAPPARVREGRARGADLFGASESAGQGEALLNNSSSLPLGQYDEKPIGARNENSVLFSLDTLKAGVRRGGPSSAPPRLPYGAPQQTAADILGLGAGGALPGMDSSAALLTAPAVEAPAPMPVAEAPQQRSRMDTTPPTSRGKGQILLIAAVVVGAVAVAGSAFVVLRSRLSTTPPSASAAAATIAPTVSAAPPAPVATAPTTQVATAAPPAPEPPPAATDATRRRGRFGAGRAGWDDQRRAGVAGGEDRSDEAAMRPDDAPKSAKPDDKPSGKLVLAEDTPSGAAAGGDSPAPAEAPEPPKPPFDTGAAKTALEAASSNASSCKKPDGPTGRGKVQITFSPSGRATSANVTEGAFGGTPTGGCVAKTFRAARVPAFSGDPVTVSKSFNIPE